MNRTQAVCLGALILVSFLLATSASCEAPHLSSGQTVYVSVYSHIYMGDKPISTNLTITLSLRNTDPDDSITFLAADYYDTGGRLIKKYIDKPVTLTPLMTKDYVVKAHDTAGGSGANFILKWKSSKPVNPALVEAVHISWQGQLGASFVTTGRVIQEHTP